MITTAPPGTPYHRLARTDAHRWWRPLAGTAEVLLAWVLLGLVLLFGSLAVSFAVDLPKGADGFPTLPPLADAAVMLLAIAAALPAVLLGARWLQRRPAGTVSSVTGRLRFGWLLICLPVALAATGLSLGGAGLLLPAGSDDGSADGWVGWPPFLISMAVLLVAVPLQAAAEEYLCRGWLLQAVGSVVRRPWLPIAVQAIIFAALHGWGTGWGFADLLIFGVVAGWLTIRTGGLEAAIALHVANNLVGFGVGAAFGLLDSDETAADAPWQMFAVDVPVMLAFAAVILWLARRRGLATVSPAAVPPRGGWCGWPGGGAEPVAVPPPGGWRGSPREPAGRDAMMPGGERPAPGAASLSR